MQQFEKKQISEDILYKSLIGNDIEILDSNNKNQIGIKGKIVYESAKLFYVEQDGEVKRILKRNITFKSKHGRQNLSISGKLLVNTVTQRIKKVK